VNEWIPVESSHIEAFRHDGEDLYVRFNDGRVYRYVGVPEEISRQIARTESPGKFLRRFIMPHFRYERHADHP